MKNRNVILVGLGLLLASYLFFYFSDKQQIKRQIETLALRVTILGPTPQLKQLTLAQNLSELFHPECEVVVQSQVRPIPSVQSRKQVRDYALLMYRSLDYIKVTVKDLDFRNADGDYHVRATLHVQLSQEKDHFENVPIQFIFKKHDGDWLIANLKNETPLGF